MKVEFTFKGGAVQVKEIIPHETFLDVIKPSKERLNILSLIESKKLSEEQKKEIVDLESKLEPYKNGGWCTDQSAFGLSVHNGLLVLPENQGGVHEVSIKIYRGLEK